MAQVSKEERARRDALATQGLKWCPKCSTAKPFAQFFRKASARDGYRAECRSCEYERQKKYSAANPEKVKTWRQNNYWRDPDHKRAQKRADYYRHRSERIDKVRAAVDPEKKRQYDREYRKRPEVKARQDEQKARYKREQRAKYRAHYYVKNAIRDGRLVRQPCEVCGKPRAEAHHDDYSKPLEVRWLCKAHHRAAHAVFTA